MRRTHEGAFVGIAIAPATKHTNELAGRGFAQGGQDISQGVFGVGIVHKNVAAFGVGDALQPAGHGFHVCQRGNHGGQWNAARAPTAIAASAFITLKRPVTFRVRCALPTA